MWLLARLVGLAAPDADDDVLRDALHVPADDAQQLRPPAAAVLMHVEGR